MPSNDKVLSILKTALKIESDGANFYSMAAKSSGNDSARKIFEFLVEEEKKHYEFFLAPLKDVESGGSFDFKEKLGTFKKDNNKDSTKVFDAAFLKRLKGDNHSLSAVSIGIQLEQNAINFYKEQKSKTKDADEIKFYDFLIETEVGHHDLLTRMEKELLEESWEENRFSPF